jgi:hypothetical protein
MALIYRDLKSSFISLLYPVLFKTVGHSNKNFLLPVLTPGTRYFLLPGLSGNAFNYVKKFAKHYVHKQNTLFKPTNNL